MLQFATYYRHIHRLPQRGELKFFLWTTDITGYENTSGKTCKSELHEEFWETKISLKKTNLHVLEANIDIIIIQYHVVVFFFYFNRTPLYEREERISMQQILCFILVYYVISLLVDHDAQNRFSLLCQIFCHFKCSL